MPPQDPDSQFKFLLACIKHSVAGKINFAAVADELKIVSKAAAAKRYERLLKAHDISMPPSGRGGGEGGGGRVPAKPAKTPRKRKPARKDDDEEESDMDIKEEESPTKKSRMTNPLDGEESDEDFRY